MRINSSLSQGNEGGAEDILPHLAPISCALHLIGLWHRNWPLLLRYARPRKCFSNRNPQLLIPATMNNSILIICEWALVIILAALFCISCYALIIGAWWHIITATGSGILALIIHTDIEERKEL